MKMTYDRKLTPEFMTALLNGVLLPLLNRIKEDQTLMLAIRKNYINIYYRGGNLCKVSRNGDGAVYTAYFDKKYNKKPKDLPVRFPFSLNNCEQVSALLEAIPELKYRMDNFLTKHGKSEREFQQLVVRENNYSPIAGKTHYFIVDIEIAGILPGARYDMLAVRWLSHERNLPGALVPALIEMKYGTDALDGLAGLKKHMGDAYALRGNKAEWGNVLSGLEAQLNQLDELGLLTFNRSARVKRLEIDRVATPELIFLLAGHNPGSTKLATILNAVDIVEAERGSFDLLFFVSSFAGYGMYREAMLNLEQFKTEVSRLFNLASSTRSRTQGLVTCPDSSDHV
jgi:hypothetical protein